MPPAETGGISRRMSGVLGLLVVVSLLNYIDRSNLAVAAPLLKDELGLSPERLGLLLAAFFWTYTALQPIAGWLVDHFDVKYVIATGFFLWSAATAGTGLVHIFATLMAARLILGVGESIAYPSYSKILARHFPDHRRGLANALIATGTLLGPGFGIFAGGNLMARFGWRPFFVALGIASMLWLPAWLAAMPRDVRDVAGVKKDAISIRQFLRLRAAWGACGGHFAHNYTSYFLITWLPYYLVRQRGFSMQSMATIGALAYLLAALACTAAGWLSDHWIKAGGDPSRVRKTFLGGGLAIAAMFLVLASFGGSRQSAAMLVLATASFSICGSHVFVAAQSLAGPEAAGRWTGMQNFAGNLAGPIAPALTGFVLQRTGSFTAAFGITTAILLFGTFCWCVVIPRVEQVHWGETIALGQSEALTQPSAH
jgi:ACS family D-galactonate transporter-like MFS transporter